MREFASTGLLVSSILLGIVVFTQLIRLLGESVSGVLAVDGVLAMLGFTSLNYLPVLLSISLFLSVLLTLSRSYRDSEMVVWFTSGIGLTRWIRPVLGYAIPVTLVIALLSLVLSPWALTKADEFKRRLDSRDDVSAATPGAFRESKQSDRVFFLEDVDTQNKRVGNIFVQSTQNGKEGTMVAKEGYQETAPNGDRFLIMLNGTRYEGIPGQADFKIVEFERYAMRIEAAELRQEVPNLKAYPTLYLLRNPTSWNISELEWRIGLPLSALVLVAAGDSVELCESACGAFAQPDFRDGHLHVLQQHDQRDQFLGRPRQHQSGGGYFGHTRADVRRDAAVVLSPFVGICLAQVETMRLLTRYLKREIYVSIALVFAALIMLFALLDLINELNSMGRGDYKLGYVLLFVTLTIPGHIYELFPVAVLIGTIFAMVQMAASSELTVYRSSGVSLKQMMGALLKIGLPLVILCFLFGEVVAPPSERMAQQLRLKAQNAKVSVKEFRSGVWVKDEHSFINVKSVLPDTSLLDVSIYEFDERYHLRSITEAERASYLEDSRWQLEGVRQTLFDKAGATTDNRPRAEWRSSLNPDILSVLLVVPEQMSAWNLYQYAGHLRENHQKTTRYEIAMWNKLVYPFAVLVMMLLALPFSAYQRREGGISGKIFMGIVLGLSFHFIGRLFANVGALNDWSPILSATAMSWLFLALALGMLWRTERR